jgi:hypothetical protein
MSGIPHWTLILLDWLSFCGHRLMMLTRLHDSPLNRICLPCCARWAPR